MAAFRVFVRLLRDFYDELVLLGVLNVVTLLAQFTIVLGPPTLLALHCVARRIAGGEGATYAHYRAGFREHFGASWRYAIPATLLNLLLAANIWFYGTQVKTSWSGWVQGAWLALLFYALVAQLYVIPLYLEQSDRRWRVAWRNAALVAVTNPLYTLILLTAGAALSAVSLFLLPLFLLFGLALWAMIGNAAVHDRMQLFRARAGGGPAQGAA